MLLFINFTLVNVGTKSESLERENILKACVCIVPFYFPGSAAFELQDNVNKLSG